MFQLEVRITRGSVQLELDNSRLQINYKKSLDALNISTTLSFIPNFKTKTSQTTSKHPLQCLTSTPPVFPSSSSFSLWSHTQVTRSTTPSTVAMGESSIPPMMYQLYLRALYQPLLNTWSASPPSLWHEGVISLLNANARKLYWLILVVVVADTICWRYQAWTIGPTSEVRPYYLFVVKAQSWLVLSQTHTFFNPFLEIKKII